VTSTYRPPEPVPAATVILLRPTPPDFEVFLARRHIKSDFAPDVFVFPGGKASHDDVPAPGELDRADWPVLSPAREPAPGWPAIHMAAIRELFEESGIVLARSSNGSPLALTDDHDLGVRFDHYRAEVREGTLTLSELARREGLVYQGGQLHLFSNWITPPVLNKRFDTFFFVTSSPEGQTAVHSDLHELTDSIWIRPEEALARYWAGSFPLVFATERNLERLAGMSSIEAVIESTGGAVETVTPRWQDLNGDRRFLIPGDPGYEAALSE